MQEVVIATMLTRHFEFKVARATVPDAKKALVALWKKHLSQFTAAERLHANMPRASFSALENAFEVKVDTLDFTKGYFDGEARDMV